MDMPQFQPSTQAHELIAYRVIVVNHKGMNGTNENTGLWDPDWAKNGSYFVFRKMEQDVEAFHK